MGLTMEKFHVRCWSWIALVVIVVHWNAQLARGDCIASNPTFNEEIAGPGRTIPMPGSCCMADVCGLECPQTVPPPAPGYGIAIAILIGITAFLGLMTFLLIHGEAVNYFVAGRSLPLWIVTVALAVQALDYSSLLGNVDLSYKFSFYDGAVFPIGLGLSLVINGIFLAHHINQDNALTLVDVFAKRYGRLVEVLASLATVTSFIMLLAGNLKALGRITAYTWYITEEQGVWASATVTWMYTKCGGLYSVVYTGIFQAAVFWSGCLVMAYWFIAEEPSAPAPSIGFPGYIYPDSFGDGGACDVYNGTKCEYSDSCCYNTALWCPSYPQTPCDRYDRAAYPFGDQQVYENQMTSPTALSPFPNALLWNWASIFILALGNLAALDFQARCIASDSPRTARLACILAGFITLFIGIPFSYLGSITRVYYGPDSVYSLFDADTCSDALGVPNCGLWIPDKLAFLKLLVNQAPPFLGGWCLIAIVAASMSTAGGAIHAMGTVVSNNLVRQLDAYIPGLVTYDNLLEVARILSIPVTIISACIAAYYESSSANTGGTGYLLIVAFDIVLATVVVPLIGCFYARNPSPRAALVAILGGAITRTTLEYTLPKDGFLIMPYDDPAFMNVGPAASIYPPAFIDTNQTTWNPEDQPCQQVPYEDYTGVDSLAGFAVCLTLYLSIQFLENKRRRPLFRFPGDQGYVKDTKEAMRPEIMPPLVVKPLRTVYPDIIVERAPTDSKGKLDSEASTMTAVTSISDRSAVPTAGGGPSLPVLQVDGPTPTAGLHPSDAQQGDKKAASDLDVYVDSVTENNVSIGENSFVLPRCALPPQEELQPVEDFVEGAVRDQDELADTASPVKNYKVILDSIRLKRDIDMLRKLLIALRTSGHGSTMHRLTSTKKHARLIHPILRLNPFELPANGSSSNNNLPSGRPAFTSDFDLADAQLHFLSAVVSANAVFLVPTLTFAWKLLTSQHENAAPERTLRCHAFLATVLRLVPKAKAELFPVMSSCAPFRSREVSEIVHYYRSCLVVLRYHPGLQTSVLDLMVDKCLEMDVEIKISDLGEASLDDENDKGGGDMSSVFELELNVPNAAKRDDPTTVDEMASKLDGLMMLLFEYITQSNGSVTILYDVFVRVFESSILICYKSKFVQYVLFYLCGLKEESHNRGNAGKDDQQAPVVLHRDFLSKLIQIVLDPFRATATRQSGACYVASFVSRARFVSPETVCEAVSALLRWAEAYIQSLDASDSPVISATANPGQLTMEDAQEQCSLHSLFYTVCQSAFYIMCFRGAEALSYFREAVGSTPDAVFNLQHIDISQQRWTKICGHPTQPLRFCLESVRVEFLSLAGSNGLLDEDVLQSLKMQELSPSRGRSRKGATAIRTAATVEKERLSGGVGGLGRGQNPLDSFFPFDPYLLSKSYAYLEPLYIHWCGVVGESGVSDSMISSAMADDVDVGALSDVDDDDDDASQESGSDGSATDEHDENGSKSDDEGDESDEEGSRAEPTDRQPMSYVSTSSSIAAGSPLAPSKREELRAAWTDTLKRSRAASVENGSW